MSLKVLPMILVLVTPLLPSQSSSMKPLGLHWEAALRLEQRTAVMTYDPHRRVVLRFGGGLGHLGTDNPFLSNNSTMEWDGRAWRACKPLHAPSPRSHHGMAYDPVSKRVILFGGGDGQKIFGDTWAWDGQDWTQLKPKNSPTPRLIPAMGTNHGGGTLYLFGGGLGYANLFWGFNPQADTWKWTGLDWELQKPAVSPPARGIGDGQGGFFYCPKNKRMVMLGGSTSSLSVPPSETWEWDGKSWYSHATVPSFNFYGTGLPYWKTGEAAFIGQTYDLQNKLMVLHLAYWDGVSWRDSKVQTPTGVQAIGAVGVDHLSEIMVLARPFPQTGLDGFDVQTWTFDGTTWRQHIVNETRITYGEGLVHDEARDETLLLSYPDWQVNPKAMGIRRLRPDGSFEKVVTGFAPPYRDAFTALYHPGMRRVWMAGGVDSLSSHTPSHLKDCWSWDGKVWQKLNASGAPVLLYAVCAFDAARGQVVALLVDGSFMRWQEQSGWTGLPAVKQPPTRAFGSLAFDANRNKIVLFGGSGKSQNLNDTWEYDGKTWTEVKTTTRPPARAQQRMHYVPSLGGILMFGGTNGPFPFRDSWLYDGKDWKLLSVEEYKAYRLGSGMITNSTCVVSRQKVLAIVPPGSAVDMLWEFQSKTLATTQPYPRPGGSLRLDALLPDQAGRPILFLMAGADRPGIPLKPVPGLGTELLPLAPDSLFLASLSMGLVTVLDGQGKAALPLGVPILASLVGLELHVAAITLDLKGGFGAITNGVPLRVVR